MTAVSPRGCRRSCRTWALTLLIAGLHIVAWGEELDGSGRGFAESSGNHILGEEVCFFSRFFFLVWTMASSVQATNCAMGGLGQFECFDTIK
jgi:hypothetical protein